MRSGLKGQDPPGYRTGEQVKCNGQRDGHGARPGMPEDEQARDHDELHDLRDHHRDRDRSQPEEGLAHGDERPGRRGDEEAQAANQRRFQHDRRIVADENEADREEIHDGAERHAERQEARDDATDVVARLEDLADDDPAARRSTGGADYDGK